MVFAPRRLLKTLLSTYINARFNLIAKTGSFDQACEYLENVDKRMIGNVLTRHGASIGQCVDIERKLTFHNCSSFDNLRIGDNSHIGKECFFDLRSNITIGERVTISMRTMFLTHIDVGKSFTSAVYSSTASSILIYDDVYIGAGCIVLPGIRIGKGSVIAAGSVVTSDIADSVLAAGVPAEEKKKLSGNVSHEIEPE